MKDVSDNVLHPKVSLDGLKTRQQGIAAVSAFLVLLGLGLLFLVIFMTYLMTIPTNFWFKMIPFTIIGAGIHIAIFRGFRASLDEAKFKRLGKPENFRVSGKVPIRWYDFFIGIPFGLFFALM